METLVNASPATVSRAGIIFVSDTDLDWSPVVEGWILKRPAAEQPVFKELFDRCGMLHHHDCPSSLSTVLKRYFTLLAVALERNLKFKYSFVAINLLTDVSPPCKISFFFSSPLRGDQMDGRKRAHQSRSLHRLPEQKHGTGAELLFYVPATMPPEYQKTDHRCFIQY